jgi:class 3 adenylate cyclase
MPLIDRRQQRSWTLHLASPPERIWPLLADTARMNEAGRLLPKHLIEDVLQPDGRVVHLARGRFGPWVLEWEDRPYEWVKDRSYRHLRIFRKGPLRRFGQICELRRDGDCTRLDFTLQIEAKGWLGALLFRLVVLDVAGKAVMRLIKRAEAFVAGARETPYDYAPAALPTGAAARVAVHVAEIESGTYGHGMAKRLGEHLLTAQEVDLTHMRPLKLARDWSADARLVIELFFEATRCGLLKLSWDLLCPRCRGAKHSVATLDQLPRTAHCSSCNIAFDAQFARNVELSFQPSPTIRPVGGGEYCLNGPYATPHVVVQQILDAGEVRNVAATLPAGSYRLRTLDAGGQVDVEHDGREFPTIVVERGPDGMPAIAVAQPAPAGEIRMENRGSRDAGIVVESRGWVRDALTAHRATTMQAFRDLLPGHALRPDEDVAIDNVTLMFTDLKGSTALYERIGDGRAYRLVRDHFAFLAGVVRSHNGTLVKTIGDAVMAAFSDPAEAVAAALEVQEEVANFNARTDDEEITIKLGLHGGSCIAVTMNDRLDYFGSIVNTAARLQGQSRGGDIVLSQSLADDAAVATLIAGRATQGEMAPLKGLARPVAFRRLLASAWLVGEG